MTGRSALTIPALLAVVLLALGCCGAVWAGEGSTRYRLPKGVYIDLTKDFYEALRQEGVSGSKTYSNDFSAEYLRQIAVSTRFMVETNLQVLRQQERLIQLLLLMLKERQP